MNEAKGMTAVGEVSLCDSSLEKLRERAACEAEQPRKVRSYIELRTKIAAAIRALDIGAAPPLCRSEGVDDEQELKVLAYCGQFHPGSNGFRDDCCHCQAGLYSIKRAYEMGKLAAPVPVSEGAERGKVTAARLAKLLLDEAIRTNEMEIYKGSEYSITINGMLDCAAIADSLNSQLGERGEEEAKLEPKPMSLCCPRCGTAHIDEGEWATRPHRTHLCQFCGLKWRPFDYPTVGVGGAAAPAPLEQAQKEYDASNELSEEPSLRESAGRRMPTCEDAIGAICLQLGIKKDSTLPDIFQAIDKKKSRLSHVREALERIRRICNRRFSSADIEVREIVNKLLAAEEEGK